MSNIQAIKNSIEMMKGDFKKSLPSHIDPDKFIRAAQSAAILNPKLLESNKQAFFASLAKAAQTGLLVDGEQSAIVEFKGKPAFIPMYQGLLKLAYESGKIRNITSDVVYENDLFEYFYDEQGQHIKHSPKVFGDRGEVIGAYSAAITTDGMIYVAVMNMNEINAVKAVSRAQNGPWSGPFKNEMYKKTVFKRLFKVLPKSTELDQVIKAIKEDEEIVFEEAERPAKAPLSRLKNLIGKPIEQTEIEAEPEFVDHAPSEELKTEIDELI